MIKLRFFGMLAGAVLLVGALFVLLGGAPALAQDQPAVIGDLALVKYVCPSDIGGSGTSIPNGCVDANDPNGGDVPVIPVNGAVSFLYSVEYLACPPGVICEPINPISVTISDNQLPAAQSYPQPSIYGPLVDSGSNGQMEPGDIWLFKVNGLQAFDLAQPGLILPAGGTPVPGCAAAQGGSRPTYVNNAQIVAPVGSQQDPSAYCNPPATATPSVTPTQTGTTTPTVTPTSTPVVRPTDTPSRPVTIPEPVTVVLFGTGLAALSAAIAARKRGNQ